MNWLSIFNLQYGLQKVLRRLLNAQVNFDGSKPTQTEGEAMVLELQKGGHEIDRKLAAGDVQLFRSSQAAQTPEKFDNLSADETSSDNGSLPEGDDEDASDGRPCPCWKPTLSSVASCSFC